jgi:hypothetical protein
MLSMAYGSGLSNANRVHIPPVNVILFPAFLAEYLTLARMIIHTLNFTKI